MRVQETFINETEKPRVLPKTKPEVKPLTQPSRRNRPFLPERETQPPPKAIFEIGDGDLERKIVKVNSASENYINLSVILNGQTVEIEFDKDDLLDTPLAYDEPWVYSFNSINAPDGNNYRIIATYYGHPETDLEFDEIDDTRIELV
jgi:hypothetical protein